MTIPKKIRIGGHTVKIVFGIINDDMGKGELAETNYENNTITIDSRLARSQQESALIHEIFHLLNGTFNSSSNYAHALLDSLSEQFYQVLSDNKLLR